MGKNLIIDRGNTTTKVAVYEGDGLIAHKSLLNASAAEIAAFAGNFGVSEAIFCSVAGSLTGLDDALQLCGTSLMVMDAQTPTPLTVDYATPLTLGVDRKAAAVGGITLFPDRDMLIVDIGTAVTYDRISAGARFLGGNIAPGIGMRLNAMHRFTSKLPKVESRGELMLWGNSTSTAMRAGAVMGVVGEISYYRSCLPDNTLIVLTGGWAADIASMLRFSVEVCPHLVTDGLNRILQYNLAPCDA